MTLDGSQSFWKIFWRWGRTIRVMETNAAAIRIYEKTGFRKAGVIPNKILRKGRQIDIVVMYADLRKR